jgi:Gpi18-like mannosyltransferase
MSTGEGQKMSLSGSVRGTAEDNHPVHEQASTTSAAAAQRPAREGPSERTRRFYVITLAALVVLLAFGVRLALFRYQTADYTAFYRRWYDFVVSHGGVEALQYEFSDLNAPYRYFMVVLPHLPVPSPLAGIKAFSVFFEVVAAFFVYRIVALKYPSRWIPAAAAFTVFMLPTVVINSSMWAQGDAIYTAFSLGGVYFLLRKRPWWACVFFGLALSFKLQAIFVFPLLLVMVLLGRVPWRSLLAIPAVYIALDVPALLLGASPVKLLTIYLSQTSIYPDMTLSAPNIWQFFRGEHGMETMKTAAILLTGLLILTLCLLVVLSRVELTDTRILLIGAISAILVPFVLPSMHERYFYLADVLTVVLAFHLPRRLWFIPIIVEFCSLMCYIPNIFFAKAGGETVDFRILAALELCALVLLVRYAVWDFRTPRDTGHAESLAR